MKPMQILGVVALAVGGMLLWIGVRASNAPVEQVADVLTGRYTDRTMMYFVGGGTAALAGVLLIGFARRK
ncbi:MAG: DUF3185 family protein [Acetobacteraceae bacterium]|nr:DUF3185 family protein [Acetobacteraceae bacterium]